MPNSNKSILERMQAHWSESIQVKEDFFQKNSATVLKAVESMATTIRNGNKILVCGNGGSAADALHFAGEMIGRFLRERRPLPMLALNSDVATMTAVGNDYGYDQVFSRQVQGLGQKGDLLFAISTSGNSANVMKAVEAAREKGMQIIALTGNTGGKLGNQADIHLNVSAGKNSPRIQETHITIIHVLVDLLDEFYLSS